MTAPPLARDTGDTGRYYVHPLDDTVEPYISVTNVSDSVRDKHAMEGLIGWGVKVTAEFWRDNLPRAVAASMTEDALEEFVKESKDQRNHVSERASLLGSMIHARAEAHVLGTDVDLAAFARGHRLFTKDGDPDVAYVEDLYQDSEVEVASYLKWLADFGVDLTQHVEASECTVANNTHRYAGTLDLLIWLPIDPATNQYDPKRLHLWVIDVKSSRTQPRTRIYPGHVLQLAGLRGGEEVWLPNGVEKMPGPITGAAILNVRRQKYVVCQCGKQLAVGGAAASHARANDGNPGHDLDTDYRELYGFIPLSEYTGGDAQAAFVTAANTVRWLHSWVDRDIPKPLDIDAVKPPRLRVVPGGQRKGHRSALADRDPLAVTTDPSTDTPF
ncbi:MAG: hypothetical protein J2P24_18905 [Streptosporangiales bacterium]|nr:hypothetical protein [Streptosporangiales bacterium]